MKGIVVFVACRGLCIGLTPRPEDPYRVWCVLSMIMKGISFSRCDRFRTGNSARLLVEGMQSEDINSVNNSCAIEYLFLA